MKHILVVLLFFCGGPAQSAPGPLTLLKESFQADEAKRISLIVTKKEAKELTQSARSPVKAGVVRAYTAKKQGKVVGGAILLIRRVRTKDMATLYLIENAGQIKSTEVLAFYEPPEYEPSDRWLKQFRGKNLQQRLTIGSDLTNITGATLSAEEVSRGARFAVRLFKMKQKEFR